MKPVTRGHWNLICQAASQCDRVHVIVSEGDRGGRNGEMRVLGDDMREVWARFLTSHLPQNAGVEFVPNPVNRTFDIFQGRDSYYIYCDPDDAERFGVGFLPKNVHVIVMKREGVRDISGTRMRQFLLEGRQEEFLDGSPPGIDGVGVWDLLTRRRIIPW